jgi:hypothetical protein
MKKILIFTIFCSLLSCRNGNENKKNQHSFFDSKEGILNEIFKGKYDKKTEYLLWKPNSKDEINASDDGFCHTNFDEVLFFEENEVESALVILRTIEFSNGMENDCAGCAPIIGLALYQKSDSNWELKFAKPNVCTYGQASMVPNKKIINLGGNLSVLSLKEEVFLDYGREVFISLEKGFMEIFNYEHSIGGEQFTETKFELLKNSKNQEGNFDLKLSSTIVDYMTDSVKELKNQNVREFRFDKVTRKYIQK